MEMSDPLDAARRGVPSSGDPHDELVVAPHTTYRKWLERLNLLSPYTAGGEYGLRYAPYWAVRMMEWVGHASLFTTEETLYAAVEKIAGDRELQRAVVAARIVGAKAVEVLVMVEDWRSDG